MTFGLLGGLRVQEFAAAASPLDDGEAMAELHAVRAELEAAEECGRVEPVCGGERVGWLEFEAVLGDEAGRIGLGGEVVVECDRRRPELGLDAEAWVPLNGREVAFGIVAEQVRENGKARRDAADHERLLAESAEALDLPAKRTADQ